MNREAHVPDGRQSAEPLEEALDLELGRAALMPPPGLPRWANQLGGAHLNAMLRPGTGREK